MLLNFSIYLRPSSTVRALPSTVCALTPCLVTWLYIDLTSVMVPGMAAVLGALGWHVKNKPETSALIAELFLTLFVREVIVGV